MIEFILFPGPSTDDTGAIVGESLVCPSTFGNPLCDDLGVPEDELWVLTPDGEKPVEWGVELRLDL